MPNKKEQVKFTIPEASLHTLPMVRLAEYLKKLSGIFGYEDHIHFLKMEEGSAVAVAEIDSEVSPLVIERTRNAVRHRGPKQAVDNYDSLLGMLEEDGYTAKVSQNGDLIAEFSVRPRDRDDVIGPIWQDGTIDGFVTRVEGSDETIHLTLLTDRGRQAAETNKELGVKLGPLFYHYIRISGRGRWTRTAEGKWVLDKFIFQSYEPLETTSLQEIVARLQSIPGNDLYNLADPITEMLKLRNCD